MLSSGGVITNHRDGDSDDDYDDDDDDGHWSHRRHYWRWIRCDGQCVEATMFIVDWLAYYDIVTLADLLTRLTGNRATGERYERGFTRHWDRPKFNKAEVNYELPGFTLLW